MGKFFQKIFSNKQIATSDDKIKIIICDDHSLFRGGVRNALSKRKEIEMIGEAEHGLDLLRKLEVLHPDLVIMGISMPVMDGVTTLPLLRQKYLALKVIILTMHNDPSVICRMIELGANAYLTKASDSEEIYQAIIGCSKNWFYINDLVIDAFSTRLLKAHDQILAVNFSEKEIAIIKLLSAKKMIEEIASDVDLSPRTVEALIDRLKKKTRTNTLAEMLEVVNERVD